MSQADFPTATNPGYADQERRRAEEIRRMIDYANSVRRAEQEQSPGPEPTPAPSPTPTPAPQEPQQPQGGVSPTMGVVAAKNVYDLWSGAQGGAAAETGAGTAGTAGTAGAASVGEYGAGAISVPAGEAVPAGYTGAATMADGSTAAVPATQGGFTLGQGALGTAGSIGLVGAGGYGMYRTLEGGNSKPRTTKNVGSRTAQGAASGAAVGAGIGSVVPGIGTVIGGVVGGIVGGVAGLVRGLWHAGKHGDQMSRDGLRSNLEQNGFATFEPNARGHNSHQVTLADGTKYDIGLDGGNRYMSAKGNEYAPYEVDPDHEFSHQAVGWVLPLAKIMTGGDEKLTTDLVGYLTNASISNAETMEGVRANVLSFFEQAGLDAESATKILNDMKEKGLISPQEYDSFIYGIGTLMKGDESLYQYGSTTQYAEQYRADAAAAEQSQPQVNVESGKPL